MVRRALRSTSLRNVQRKTPSGKNVIHYERKSGSAPVCGSCKAKISPKATNRVYGGNLCPSCTKERIKGKVLKG